MGTNFYWRNPDAMNIPTTLRIRDHLGKRSAAGWYCWDCHIPLVAGGKAFVHSSQAQRFERCPECGKEKPDEGIPAFAALVELGFARPRDTTPPTGVTTCSSFSFAQDPEMIQGLCQRWKHEQIIEDEYGHLFTGQQFTDMLVCNCPIRFFHSIDVDFC